MRKVLGFKEKATERGGGLGGAAPQRKRCQARSRGLPSPWGQGACGAWTAPASACGGGWGGYPAGWRSARGAARRPRSRASPRPPPTTPTSWRPPPRRGRGPAAAAWTSRYRRSRSRRGGAPTAAACTRSAAPSRRLPLAHMDGQDAFLCVPMVRGTSALMFTNHNTHSPP